MAQFTANQGGTFTPSTTNDNITLQAPTTGFMGKVKMFNWGGDGTSLVGYRTRWTRSTVDPTGAATALTIGRSSPASAPNIVAASTFATTQATLGADPAGNLFAQNWNVQGGGGAIVLPIGGEWFVIQSATAGYSYICCRNTVGTDANLSSYGFQWEE